ncbi:MAG: glycosyltransferase family 2 protein [Verrucomicrobiae bacterium]|nr:glycosyltransferase family 2 protein [Verrucomicrobiae bacterium]
MSMRMGSPYLSVIVPVYNEEENVASVAAEVAGVLDRATLDYEILFVNDCSSDGTGVRLDELRRANPRLRALHLARKTGQSGALYAGLRAARGEVIATLDGDGQNDPADILRLLERLRRGDVAMVCGWRTQRRDSLVKRISARIANRVRNWVTADGVHDTGACPRVFTRAVAEAMIAFNGMHRFMPALALMGGFKITEMPVAHRQRRHGVSKYGIGGRLLRGLFDLVGVLWLRRRVVRPVVERES